MVVHIQQGNRTLCGMTAREAKREGERVFTYREWMLGGREEMETCVSCLAKFEEKGLTE